MKMISNILKKNLILFSILAAVLIAGIFFTIIAKRVNHNEPVMNMETKNYTLEERNVANGVIEYLKQYLVLDELEQNGISDFVVGNYNAILHSGVPEISDEHAAALHAAIKTKLNEILSGAQLTDDELNVLSSGISVIIMDYILAQLEQSGLDTTTEDFTILADSLQKQVNELKQRSMSLNISANIKKGESGNQDDLEEKISELSKQYNDSLRDLNNKISKISTQDGKDGRDGKDGTAGKVGNSGGDGTDGKNGTDGKSTYIAYADNAAGHGFSLSPKESSRYIGTCVTTTTTQPKNQEAYTWQIYRTYIITSVTDENDITTLYIK